MDLEAYQEKYFTKPTPEQRHGCKGMHGVTLYFQDYEAAVNYYKKVLCPPGYVEGEGTRGLEV